MISVDQLNENNVLSIKVSGKLSQADYAKIIPQVENLLEKHGIIKFYIQLMDFSGFEKGALWEDIKFDFKHRNQYGKTAIVGENKWEAYATKISGLFFSAELKFFYPEQSDAAWDWLNQ